MDFEQRLTSLRNRVALDPDAVPCLSLIHIFRLCNAIIPATLGQEDLEQLFTKLGQRMIHQLCRNASLVEKPCPCLLYTSNTFRFYAEQTYDECIARVIVPKSVKRGKVFGDVFEINYREQAANVAQNSVAPDHDRLTFADGYVLDAPCRSSFDVAMALVGEHGGVKTHQTLPKDAAALSEVLTKQKSRRDRLPEAERTEALSPLPVAELRKYEVVKKAHPDALVCFAQNGYFELYGKDAEKAAPLLGTKLLEKKVRGKPSVPVTGFRESAWVAGSHQLWKSGVDVFLSKGGETFKELDVYKRQVYIMSQEQLSMYATYMSVLGNREDLFGNSPYVDKYITNPPADYDVNPEYLNDEKFATLITEAEKYLGYPYVWGGSNPDTSFDCSGFVSYVLTNSGLVNTGRLGAQGLYNVCTPVSKANAQPGDLIFFVGTYDTPGVSHVGIYVGDGVMIHCGDPIQYLSLIHIWLVQQCIKQVMEPVCEAKFSNNSYGFRPNHSVENATARSYQLLQHANLHYVIAVSYTHLDVYKRQLHRHGVLDEGKRRNLHPCHKGASEAC